MMKVSEADIIRHARRIVEADAFALALLVELEGWTVAQVIRLDRLAAAAAAVNPRPAVD